jgi:hypothetical protein
MGGNVRHHIHDVGLNLKQTLLPRMIIIQFCAQQTDKRIGLIQFAIAFNSYIVLFTGHISKDFGQALISGTCVNSHFPQF